MSQNIKWQRFWRRFKVFIILIIAVFAFAIIGLFQGPEFLSGGGVAAMVNGQPVTLMDFRRAVENMERSLGGRINSLPAAQRQMFTRSLRQRALNQLISQKLAIQAATEERFFVSDQEVMDRIIEIGIFQENGNFNRQAYERYLQATRTSVADFESERRDEIIINRLQMAFTRGAKALPVEAELLAKAQGTELELRFADLSASGGSIKISDSAAKSYLENNGDSVQTFYEDNKVARYKTEEKVEARHILVKIDGKTDEATAKKKVDSLKSKATKENFAELATSSSDDPGSAKNGGSLGSFSKGAMVPEFEEAAFSAEAGSIVGPIKTQFGYHLIYVENKIPAGTEPFDSVKLAIAKELAQKSRSSELIEKVKGQLAEGKFAGVRSSLKSAGVEFVDSGNFNLAQSSIPKLGDIPGVISSVMDLEPNQMPTKLIQHLGKSYVVELKSKKVKNETLAEDKVREEQVQITSRRVGQLLSAWLEEVQESSKIVSNEQVLAAN
ncbi:MAG: hypothetical protein CL677_05490 [Bdellovibrionaceae bacterium]|nr:hypothetical protein [Pseudobdellovibrionaceae bacterium]|tara:strand:+ start:9433 stop:10926 length:1494 start_codon:yes stop_codon:yes gene_type:complete